MKRVLVAVGVLLFCAVAAGQAKKPDGWDKIKFGMSPWDVLQVYKLPSATAQFDGEHLTLGVVARGIIGVTCTFSEEKRCYRISALLETDDIETVVQRLATAYGRFKVSGAGDETRYRWGDPDARNVYAVRLRDENGKPPGATESPSGLRVMVVYQDPPMKATDARVARDPRKPPL